ncbi:hypothetical protein [Idiomarina xiamenensis]|uniref:Succinyl-diaminopimelate desuccinylase n=1 Tax=Idiomarina xiamenensis 10-D-4 TaxID=740709 RepID=K2K943_9GAMM|nr:hypothetical protein [Idiomarina xiamenensis]EKE84293.1 succinyl-diaminopimelate desuccinylase [Idiomarina xiamenensis 10-D-4]
MIRLFVIIPIVLCLLWLVYLRWHGWSLKQGRQGFVYIIVFSATIAAFYSVMLWLTQY